MFNYFDIYLQSQTKMNKSSSAIREDDYKINQQRDNDQTSLLLQGRQYFRFSAFKNKDKQYSQIYWAYNNKKYTNNRALFQAYLHIQNLKDLEKQNLMPQFILNLKELSLTDLNQKPFRQQEFPELTETQNISTWIANYGLNNIQVIPITVNIVKLSDTEQKQMIVRVKNPTSKQICFYWAQNQTLQRRHIPILSHLKDGIMKLQNIPKNFNLNDYELQVKCITGENRRVGQLLIINTTNSEGIQYIKNKDVIQIKTKHFKPKKINQQFTILLRYLSIDNQRSNLAAEIFKYKIAQTKINYYEYRQFKVSNLFRMLDIQQAEGHALLVNNKLIGSQQLLKNQLEVEVINAVKAKVKMLIGNIQNQPQVFSQFLQRNTVVNQAINQETIAKLIRDTSLTKKFNDSIQTVLNRLQSVNFKIPHISKNPAFFQTLLAYTDPTFYNQYNKYIRQTSLAETTRNISDMPMIDMTLNMTRNIQPLEYSLFQKNILFRGIKNIHEEFQKDDIIFYRQFFSTSTDRKVANKFANHLQGIHIIYKIKSFTAKNIHPFSYFYENKQYQSLIAPHTPMRIKSIRMIGGGQQIQYEEIPFIHFPQSRHLIWIGKGIDQIINFYNQLRYKQNINKIDIQFLNIELLPFFDNQGLKFWIDHFVQFGLDPIKTIVIFDLPETNKQIVERVQFMNKYLPALITICIQPNDQQYSQKIGLLKIETLRRVSSLKQLQTMIVYKQGFELKKTEGCCQIY